MTDTTVNQSWGDINRAALIGYALFFLAIGAALSLYLLQSGRYPLVLMVAVLPVAVIFITQPRWALYQYVFVLFIELVIAPSIPLMLIDISAVIVILNRLPYRLPPLSLNYVYLIIVLVVCTFLGYWPELAGRRIAKMIVILVSFWAVYRLSGKLAISRLLNWYFLLAVVHSIYVLIPFIASGGMARSFGFTRTSFDDLAMVALPVGLALYLGAECGKAGLYLFGCVLVLGGLVATQSRAPIVIGLVSSLFVLLSARTVIFANNPSPQVDKTLKRRLRGIILSITVLVSLSLLFLTSLWEPLVNRFIDVLDVSSRDTGWRIYLWKKALLAFQAHPIFGVGPEAYKHLHELYASLRFQPAGYLLRSLTAHNLFLYFLAETGLVGGIGLVALMVNQFRLARKGASNPLRKSPGAALALYGWAFLFIVSTLIEAGWMWRQLSYVAVFFAALVARQYTDTMRMKAQAQSNSGKTLPQAPS
jgi:O-antigen ligase